MGSNRYSNKAALAERLSAGNRQMKGDGAIRMHSDWTPAFRTGRLKLQDEVVWLCWSLTTSWSRHGSEHGNAC
jgi:hypothetical protein